MSVPKYIKEVSKLQKKLRFILLIVVFISLILLILHISLELPSEALLLFIYPEIYIFWASLIGYSYLHIRSWKEKIVKAETDILETIAYRKKTSIKNLAKVKGVKEGYVISIIQRLIDQDRLFGIIKDGLYISEHTMVPICSLCNKEINDRLLMVLTPCCKRPFHKDHLIDYINEYENKCPNPNCKKILELRDIIK